MFVANPVRENFYILMSLDTPLVKLAVGESRAINRVTETYCTELMPMGVFDSVDLLHWYNGRRIPTQRKHLEDLVSKTGLNLNDILDKSMALSLSDSF